MPTFNYFHCYYLNSSSPTSGTVQGLDIGPVLVVDEDNTASVGEQIEIDNDTMTVEGVMPDGSFIVTIGSAKFLVTLTTYAPGDGVNWINSGSTTLVCFLEGTRIETEHGEVAVEALRIGDRVRTNDGDLATVRWIGRQTITRFRAPAADVHPVRILAGALAEGVPRRDLFVSPDHAMLVQGLLVHASALVNGTSITQMAEMPPRYAYYHIETEGHRVILAEGAAAETFVDNVTRQRFDNYAEYAALYPDALPIAEMTAPRVTARRLLPKRIAAELMARAEAIGVVPARAAA